MGRRKNISVNSRQKGARGERQLAKWFREYFGVFSRRAQQYSGLSDGGDVELHPSLHVECKVVERLNIHQAIEQSVRDAERNSENPVPTVWHKKNRTEWLLTIRAKDLKNLCAAVHKIKDDGKIVE